MTERYHAVFRHGAYHQQAGVPSARQPWALTDAGLQQARDGAQLLHDMLQDHGLALAPVIHSSRQLRAWQTAQALAEGLRALGHEIAELRQTSALAERGLGSAANLTVAQIEEALAADPRHAPPPVGWKSDSDYCLPLEGAESLMMAGARVATHLEQAGQPGSVTIHVGHGASFRHACYHLGLLTRDQIARFSMFHARPSLICHGADGRWRHMAGAWKIREPQSDPKD
ncbi:histidine phosphatase family protein [Pseudoponticoccus marisrubri]|uniref:Phosphoglycerate mutase n=1 Tax=Pseudoponticoccus marisrubri TaxID=1685382 RepID=A0A0W7WHM6_9RHOB|nr:histidine phosphatase family protein [Pseudoponticoccus marisrubri]KUF09991.1 phosphoglycerate mutase [Pseudoponticoccus marisrubri]